jgi:Membrane bound FAD containing D-sorbitol dehydrogenase
VTVEAVFFRLSRTITGFPELDESLVPGLLDRLRKTPESVQLERLLSTYTTLEESGEDVLAGLKKATHDDEQLRALTAMIVIAWYTGDLGTGIRSPPTEREYFSGVLWKIVHAHPPGLSGGYFGHWTYPPDAV